MAALQKLRVFLDGVLIGEVSRTSSGALSFTYDEGYRAVADATPLSMSMPLTSGRHSNRAVSAYLDGLLPDSEAARERWGRQYGANPRNAFSLLRHVGRDAAGAVQILPPEEEPSDAAVRNGDIEWLSDDDFARITRELAGHGQTWDPGRFGGRWSLAGAQPKIALFHDPLNGAWGIPHDSTPTNCIIKPALSAYESHHVNEALCQRAAREAGLLAARVDLVEIADVQALVSYRYDRVQDEEGRWRRIHQEDLCQALSVHPVAKYQKDNGPGVAAVGKLLRQLSTDDRNISVERFFKALALNALIGGTDAHAKNYSLVLIGKRVQLGPLYDVASAACYAQHTRLESAMKIGGHYTFLEMRDADWRQVGRQLGVAGDQAVAWVEELRQQLPAALTRAAESLPTDVSTVAGAMAERISEHVVGTWRPDQVVTSTTMPGPTY